MADDRRDGARERSGGARSGEGGRPGRAISRRRFLTAGVGLAALIAPRLRPTAAQGAEAPPHQQGAPPIPAGSGGAGAPSGALLAEPEVRRAAGGELRTALRARYAYVDIGGQRLHLRTYEGTIPGPTLRC